VSREKRFPTVVGLVVTLVGTLLVATPSAGVAGPTVNGDVYMRDNDATGGPGWPTDNGVEPNRWPTIWNSPDIQVPFPLIGSSSLIKVRLTNNGPDPITGDLQVFYTEQGTAARWGIDWTLINVVRRVTVPSGGLTVSVPWEKVPHPGHFCLLARWDSPDQDPMTFPEPILSNTYTNVQKNNNLAWKNVDLVRLRLGIWEWWKIRIRAPEPGPRPYDLVLAQPDRPFTDTGRLLLDLGPTLAERWKQAGQPGVGVRPHGVTQVEITDPRRAVIQNLWLNPDDQFDVDLGFFASAAAGTAPGVPYLVRVMQTDTQSRNVGGLDLTAVVE
jgi:hypothetical protein